MTLAERQLHVLLLGSHGVQRLGLIVQHLLACLKLWPQTGVMIAILAVSRK